MTAHSLPVHYSPQFHKLNKNQVSAPAAWLIGTFTKAIE
jgi:hypothetical protein